MTNWLILSDTALGKGRPEAEALLDKGLFAIEFQLPLSGPAVLVDHQVKGPEPRTFSVLFDPQVGIVLLHRRGAIQLRHRLSGPLPHCSGTAQLSFHFDAADQGVWLMRLQLPGVAAVLEASGAGALPIDMNDFDRLCAQSMGARWHRAVLWFGLSNGGALPPRRAWLGRNTPISTRNGVVLAESLRVGDEVAMADGPGFVAVQDIGRIEVPSRGSYSPVLLRAPFYGRHQDLLVSAHQLIVVGGASVEYMFGCEEVLLRASYLANGQSALLENRRASTVGITLDFGRPVLIAVDGVGMLVPTPGWTRALPRRVLDEYEAHPLLPLIGPGNMRISAV